jgi:predicted flap endonuclease-1-like 5' DNA nuclease
MMENMWWLWILLAFVLIAFLIWLLGRSKGAPPANMAHPAPHDEIEAPVAAIAPAPPELQSVSPAAADDLEIIEGIGSKIASLLRQGGIGSFAELAASDLTRLDQILTEANLRRLANPATWPKQAALAAEGRWDELSVYQRTLKGGQVQ